MKKKTNNRRYIQPKKWDVLINNINKVVQMFVNDPRDTDSFFMRGELQETLRILSDLDLMKSNDPIHKEMVYVMGINLISTLMVQMSLFHRPIVMINTEIDETEIEVPMFPTNEVPFFTKQVNSKGKFTDYSDLHSLSIMKDYYLKIDKRSPQEIMEGKR